MEKKRGAGARQSPGAAAAETAGDWGARAKRWWRRRRQVARFHMAAGGGSASGGREDGERLAI